MATPNRSFTALRLLADAAINDVDARDDRERSGYDYGDAPGRTQPERLPGRPSMRQVRQNAEERWEDTEYRQDDVQPSRNDGRRGNRVLAAGQVAGNAGESASDGLVWTNATSTPCGEGPVTDRYGTGKIRRIHGAFRKGNLLCRAPKSSGSSSHVMT